MTVARLWIDKQGRLLIPENIRRDLRMDAEDEVVARVDRLNLPSYTGFVQPRLEAVTAEDGSIADVGISYPQDLTKQMLEYAAMTRASREEFRAAGSR